MKRIIFKTILILTSVFISLNADSFIDNYKSETDILIEQSKDIRKREESLNRLLSLALSGDGKASLWIGHLYIKGEGVKKDCKKGLLFVWSALKSGNNEALKEVALMFRDGQCGNKDMEKYRKYIKRYNNKINKNKGQ
jgi:TPR repeat protein